MLYGDKATEPPWPLEYIGLKETSRRGTDSYAVKFEGVGAARHDLAQLIGWKLGPVCVEYDAVFAATLAELLDR